QEIIDKVNKINEVRNERSKTLIAKGEEGLTPYTFDYILLCNKICGRSHYNMQAKVIVETPDEFNSWLKGQPRLGKQVAEEKAAATAPEIEIPVSIPETEIVIDSTAVVAQVIK